MKIHNKTELRNIATNRSADIDSADKDFMNNYRKYTYCKKCNILF